jgi:hypothetical protein
MMSCTSSSRRRAQRVPDPNNRELRPMPYAFHEIVWAEQADLPQRAYSPPVVRTLTHCDTQPAKSINDRVRRAPGFVQ